MNEQKTVKELHNTNWQPKYAHLLVIALVTTFFTSNILAFKFVQIGDIKFGAAAALFPFTLIIGDALSEVYGFKRTRNAVFISLVCYVFFVVMAQFTVMLPPAPEWNLQTEYENFFSTTYRVFIATSLAFLVSQLLNAFVFVKIKIMMHGKHFFVRALVATVFSEFAHTLVVAPILFGGILTLEKILSLIATATVIKILLEAALLPLTFYIINKLKTAEGIDYYDQ